LTSLTRQLPLTFSLTTPKQELTESEAAVRDLLRLVRHPREQNDKFKNSPAFQTRTPTFLSTGVPRDRRGRVALKPSADTGKTTRRISALGLEYDVASDEPRRSGRPSYVDIEQEQNQGFLEALKSPDLDSAKAMGGWGLGAAHEEGTDEEEEEDFDPKTIVSAAPSCLNFVDAAT